MEIAIRIWVRIGAPSGQFVLHEFKDLPGLGVTPQGSLGKDQLAVEFDLEGASGRIKQLDVTVRVRLSQLGRQTGGFGLVVSDDAVFDRDFHSILILVPC